MYRFRLQSVLKFRRNMERHHVQEISKLRMGLAEEERRLSRFMEEVKTAADHLVEEAGKGIDPREAALYRSYIISARTRIREQEGRILSLERNIEKKRSELISASREKKVMEKLKEKDHKRYLINQRRADQKEMDDYAVKGYVRRYGEGADK